MLQKVIFPLVCLVFTSHFSRAIGSREKKMLVSKISLALVFSTLCYATAQAETTVNFSLPPWNKSINGSIKLFYDAHFDGSSVNSIELTTTQNNKTYSAGWAVYNTSIPIWNSSSGAVVSFSTHFQFIIGPDNSNVGSGGGLAFFMAPVEFQAPELSAGKYLGLVNNNTMGNTANQLIAVEFDTDENSFDPNNNHVGIDVNTVISEANATVTDGSLIDGKIWDAWVEYDGESKKFQVFLSHNGTKSAAPILSQSLDLAKILPENAMVGFSASTSLGTNSHSLLSWNFSCSASWNAPSLQIQGPGNGSPGNKSNGEQASRMIIMAVVFPCLAVFFALGFLGIWHRRRRMNRTGSSSAIENESEIALDEQFCQGPRKFTFGELSAATKGFSEVEKLGQGGFGSVYRGVLQDSKEIVAVKHISQASTQGKKEYVAEVSIITRLGHRNLVQLLGWCHEKGKFILVYEFMPNGSLDKHIFGDFPVLYWNLRYNIACGVAAAIVYLHEDWDQCILHRDVKSSNVMLDSNFNAKLGDFGLARLVERDMEASFHTSVVAGTLGYLAPECVLTGKSSPESDVFGFGVVALEIACGRRALDLSLRENHKMRLIDWVWHQYAQGRVLEAAAESLRGKFDEREMERLMVVGLWCCNPDANARPSMREVIKVLRLEAPLPHIPLNMPVAVYISGDALQRNDDLCSTALHGSCSASSSGKATLPSEEFSGVTVFSR